MSNPAREARRVVALQYLKKGGTTPEYINMIIPTEPVRMRFGPSRGTATKGVGSGLLLGSKTLSGSPFEASYQLTKLRLTTSTPNVYFIVTHSRDGTTDVMYLPTRSDDLSFGDLHAPIDSFKPGTVRWYAMGAGSSLSGGKGSIIKFQGVGSSSPNAFGIVADFYPI